MVLRTFNEGIWGSVRWGKVALNMVGLLEKFF